MSEITIPAVERKTGTIIIIHGMGDSGAGWTWLAKHFRQKNQFDDIKFIFPSASTIPFTPAGGQKFPAWFDILRPAGTVSHPTLYSTFSHLWVSLLNKLTWF